MPSLHLGSRVSDDHNLGEVEIRLTRSQVDGPGAVIYDMSLSGWAAGAWLRGVCNTPSHPTLNSTSVLSLEHGTVPVPFLLRLGGNSTLGGGVEHAEVHSLIGFCALGLPLSHESVVLGHPTPHCGGPVVAGVSGL